MLKIRVRVDCPTDRAVASKHQRTEVQIRQRSTKCERSILSTNLFNRFLHSKGTPITWPCVNTVKKLGCCNSSVDPSPPSTCCPGFESQAHHLGFYQFIFEFCHVEKTKINKKRPGRPIEKNMVKIRLNSKAFQNGYDSTNSYSANLWFCCTYLLAKNITQWRFIFLKPIFETF